MFWICILLTALALMLVKLGAYSILLPVLTLLLCIALLVITCLAVALIWRKVPGVKKLKLD
jgi:hypothetical protein